jgi:hypothetical protein
MQKTELQMTELQVKRIFKRLHWPILKDSPIHFSMT